MHQQEFLKTFSILQVISILIVGILSVVNSPALAGSRIKDITNFGSIRDNFLVGYSLVIGLNGSGDSLSSSPFTHQSLMGMLERVGVNTVDKSVSVNTKNIAAVMVTASLPAFSRSGSRLDVSVNSIGDATSLQSGMLIFTPLRGPDGKTYAVAQGPVSIGGFKAQAKAATITKNTPTNGRITNGAIIEREIDFKLNSLTNFNISLKNPDITTSKRIADAINRHMGIMLSNALDPSTIKVIVPQKYEGRILELMSEIEQIRVQTDQIARVVIEESTGIIVIGNDVRIDTVAISQGNLQISVTESQDVSQPYPFAIGGETVITPTSSIDVQEDKDKKITPLPSAVSLEELINGLNSLGVGPQDMISILFAIKATGALQAELKVI